MQPPKQNRLLSPCISVTIHGLADKENPAVIDSGVFAWLIEVPVYF